VQGTRTVKYDLELTEAEFNDLLMSVETTLHENYAFESQRNRLTQLRDEMLHMRESGVPF